LSAHQNVQLRLYAVQPLFHRQSLKHLPVNHAQPRLANRTGAVRILLARRKSLHVAAHIRAIFG
jgi:hypothetical protein